MSLGSVGSGLPPDLVQKMVEAEREPIKQIESHKANEAAKLKLVQELNTKVSSISSAVKDLTRFRSFRDLTAVNSRPELADVILDKNVAEQGSYQMEIERLASRASMLSSGFPDKDKSTAGAGYFKYTLPSGESKEVYIEPETSSLEGIAKAINSQKDLDLNAIVVDDGTGSSKPWRLIVSHNKTGEVNDAEFPNFYFLDGDEDFSMAKDKPAMNAKLKVNGFEVEFPDNKITSLLPGVTIDLKDAAPGKEFTLKIQADVKSVKGKIEGMVGKLNDVLGFIQSQNKLDEKSNTRNTLGGDITLQTLENKIRGLVMNPFPTSAGTMRMADLGVRFDRTGMLEFKADKFESVLSKNFDAVSQFFVGMEDAGDGFAARLDESARSLTRPGGIVTSRIEGIKHRMEDYDHQVDMKERAVANTERMLKDKFARLEGTISKMKAQQTSIASLGGGG